MSFFTHPECDGHELVVAGQDAKVGLRAIIAVHSTRLGKALGGCRMWPYAGEDEALADVLRLSRSMTYKAALANLPLGGGKSVIIGDPRRDKTPALMRAMGRLVHTLGGHYIAAEDSGTSVSDIRTMSRETPYVAGFADDNALATGRTGDPAPSTAHGVFVGIQACVRERLGRGELQGLRVAVQGVGSVGYRLAKHLHNAGAQLWVADLHGPAVDRCVREFGATPVPREEIFGLDVDVVAPCAMGGAINDLTLANLKAPIVAGAANNQLSAPRLDCRLSERGILYAPDYVINAGGLIDVHYGMSQYDANKVRAHVERIGMTLATIFERARQAHRPTGTVADLMAEELLLHSERAWSVQDSTATVLQQPRQY